MGYQGQRQACSGSHVGIVSTFGCACSPQRKFEPVQPIRADKDSGTPLQEGRGWEMMWGGGCSRRRAASA